MKTKTLRIDPDRMFPENVYYAIFDYMEMPVIPPDAAETLEYVLKNKLTTRSAEILMDRYKNELSYEDIGIKHNLTPQRIRQIINRTLRDLRNLSKRQILCIGRKAYLENVVAENEERKKYYRKDISSLEGIIENQKLQLTSYNIEMNALAEKSQYNILNTNIDALGLSTRSYNCLKNAGILTVKDILDCPSYQEIPDFGIRSLQDVLSNVLVFLSKVGKIIQKLCAE